MRALHQRDGLLTGAAETHGVHAHHFITGSQTDRRRRAALLHLRKTQTAAPNLSCKAAADWQPVEKKRAFLAVIGDKSEFLVSKILQTKRKLEF